MSFVNVEESGTYMASPKYGTVGVVCVELMAWHSCIHTAFGTPPDCLHVGFGLPKGFTWSRVVLT